MVLVMMVVMVLVMMMVMAYRDGLSEDKKREFDLVWGLTSEELLTQSDELVPVTQNRRWLFRKNQTIIDNMKKCIKRVRDEVLDELMFFRSPNMTSAKKKDKTLIVSLQ